MAIDPELKALGESAGQAWSEIAPLLHPEVAQYLYTLTGQVLWLCKEVERLKVERMKAQLAHIDGEAGG